ncbi:hypothetical protein Q9L42_016970 [Methylomarinum sp. Ch1-1]|uniref:Lipoprotein n=1 Tax=Methylomarinum roseum TaxID=3067653 RepID=A0AAU7NSV4_9GAMM|nr:hypothetical protein [Methylomarinum sp. Ch1-1]MDP4519980.1 hypothetical protein [Methylomarinum sp. Ch1-1]
MKKSFPFFAILFILLPACSTPPVRQESVEQPTVADQAEEGASLRRALPAPDLYREKAGKTLKLVRIMEGGACQTEQYGVVGMFMLYADPDDIERIKQDRGAGVFAEYEKIIEQFAMLALEQAVNELQFFDNPFALDEEDVQRELAEQLIPLFDASVAEAITEFEAETTLTIDLAPLSDSFYFYLHGCEIPHQH